ncbi:hypothetical protein [Pengzhenrongella sp.]|uniref:hypothetical protein n=1 Tax=Pengzhenrongella sp. TaxID=2888820 RepID=UPI002F9433A9
MNHDEAVRLYGPWRARTPSDVAELLRGYPGRWWIAGGWAIEEFTGVGRRHDDVDPSIPRSDVDLLCDHLKGTMDVWSADSGTFRPLQRGDDELSTTCENLWLRPGGAAPWEYDVILMDTTPSTRTFKRDARISRPLDEILWTRDGIDYLRPEVQLLHKARGLRPKDQADFEACLPKLSDPARSWLADALAVAHPSHPWLGWL